MTKVYDDNSDESARIMTALEVYGKSKFAEEFRFIVQEVEQIVDHSEYTRLNEILFKATNNNAYPAVFAAIFVALHELVVPDQMKIVNYSALSSVLKNIAEKLDAGMKGANSNQRRINVDTAKGIVRTNFVHDKNITAKIYCDHKTVDIDEYISRSQIETARFELKQGLLPLQKCAVDPKPVLQKIVQTICGIANIGPTSDGRIVIGVCDTDADADRVKIVDGVTGRKVSTRSVVGVVREAARMELTVEQYFSLVRDFIVKSDTNENLRQSVLGSLNFNNYFGLGVLVITVPPQRELSLFEERVFHREGDQTCEAIKPGEIASIAQRF